MRVSVDGTDLLTCESFPFDPKWWSHKLKHSALRYEIGVSLCSGEIVSVYGPFAAGENNDQSIYNTKLVNYVPNGEKVLADRGYGGETIVHGGLLGDRDGSISGKLRAYHETVNGRIKSFLCMQHRWRHSIHKHELCFFAVANIVQIMIAHEIY